MDFRNEHYVRLYTRDSAAWGVLAWEGQLVFMQLYRKADPTGTLKLLGLEPWQLAGLVGRLPDHVAKSGMERCLERGWIVRDDAADRLVLPRYVEANRVAMSGKQRSRESRARRAATRNVSEATQNVSLATHSDTPRHAATHAETNRVAGNGSNGHGVGDPRSARAVGHMWFAEAMGRDDYPSGGKWDLAYEQIGLKPASEKADVARTIQRQLGKSGARRIMTPRHISDYWAGFAEGKPPGDYKRADGSPPPGAAEVAAAKQAFDAARAKYRAATDAETKARLMAVWSEADAILKATKARFQWTG